MAIALQHLGVAAFGRNRFEEAYERFSASLALSRDLEPLLGISALLGLAAVLAASDPEAAIRVLAASEAIAEAMHLMIERTEQGLLERTLAGCRETLSGERLDELREVGRQMSLDATADYALERARSLEGRAR